MATSQKSKGPRPFQPPEPPPPPRPVPPQSLALPPADVSGLELVRCPYNVRRDLHVFADYVRNKQVKRSVRGNGLPKADAARLAKLMSDPDAADEIRNNGYSTWINLVDDLALKLGFVSYGTKGVYAGYSSQEPSYPDNYITFHADAYEKYLAAPLAQQERRLSKVLVDDYKRGEYEYAHNEFYHTGVAGRLEPFDWAGSGVGVMPTLNFAEIREFLLGILAACPVGVWLSTADLVAHLKAHYPYFLIPQKLKPDRWGNPVAQRYGNFRERIGDRWGEGKDVPDDAADGFERVEGRYVERFLEHIPLTLGYVDLAYAEPEQKDLHPSINCLRAFRVNSRLAQVLRDDVPAAKVTVQPNFEIYIESDLYPASLLARLTPLADVIKEDVITILRLRREKVAAERAKNERLDVIGLLQGMSGRELPQNVARELREWTAQSEIFTLIEGVALFEGDLDLPSVAPFVTARIAPGLALVHSPEDLYLRLESAEQAPLWVKHEPAIFKPLPSGARTIFVTEIPVAATPPPPKRWAELRRETRMTLHFPTGYDDLLEKFRKALVEARCSVEVDKAQRTITYAKRYEGQVAGVIEGLKDEYEIQVADLE